MKKLLVISLFTLSCNQVYTDAQGRKYVIREYCAERKVVLRWSVLFKRVVTETVCMKHRYDTVWVDKKYF